MGLRASIQSSHNQPLICRIMKMTNEAIALLQLGDTNYIGWEESFVRKNHSVEPQGGVKSLSNV